MPNHTFLSFLSLFVSVCFALHPVILVPGDGGTKLIARVENDSSAPHYFCRTNYNEWFTTWVSEIELTPYIAECFVHRIKLLYDNETHTTHSYPGITIQPEGPMGDINPVTWLDDEHFLSAVNYFNDIAQTLMKNHGYVANKSLFGAPYDFRKAPNELDKFYKDFKLLIEQAYLVNGNESVILIAHSMGNPVTTYFLNRQSTEWRDKYIKCFVTLSGPWGGSMKIMRLLTSGWNLDIIIIDALTVRDAQRTFPSSYYLAPHPAFWKDDEVLVSVGDKNYTLSNMKDYFDRLAVSEYWPMYLETNKLLEPLKNPGVDVHCLHGYGLKTTERLEYAKEEFPSKGPSKVIEGDGDGTVPLRSLLGCLNWKGDNKIVHQAFPNVEHNGILHDKAVLAHIEGVLLAANKREETQQSFVKESPVAR